MWVVLSVFDRAAEIYGVLYVARTEEVGARMFADAVLGPELTVLRQHPGDFVVRNVGSFNEVSGELVGMEAVWDVIDAAEVLRRASPAGGVSGPEL